MSGPSQTISSAGLCTSSATEGHDEQKESLSLHPSSDFEESEMWKLMMQKLDEQGKRQDKKNDLKFQEQSDEHTKAMEKQKDDLEEKYDQKLQEQGDRHMQAMKKQKDDLEEKYDQKLQEQSDEHTKAMEKQKDDLEKESKENIDILKEQVKKEFEELKSTPYPEHPHILFKRLGGESAVFWYIDFLTKGVKKRLEGNAEALECYRKWVKQAKSKRFNKVTTRVAAGGAAGLAVGGAATGAVHAALIYGSGAALAKAGAVGLTVGIAGGPAAAIVVGCVTAGCLIVITAYGIYWLYCKCKKDKAENLPNREDLLDQLAQRFIIEAENKKKVDSMASEIISTLTTDQMHGDESAET